MSEMFIVRGSEYQSFLNCRKQWFYQWVLGLEPKKPSNKLFFGTLFHKWLERFYANGCKEFIADMETTLWFNDQDLSGMEQVEIDEQKALFFGVKEYYVQTYTATDSQFKILGTEVEFLVKLDEDLFMTGTIDLVYELDGKIRFMDHKTTSNIQSYVEKAEMDRQISRYWWALERIAEGIGRIKDKKTDTWVRWNELIDKKIDGFDYNLIAKDFPKEPKMLKKGGLSVDKSQKTTLDLYKRKIKELRLDANDYIEMLEFLAEKPNQFLTRINVVRTKTELEAAVWELFYTAGDMHDVKILIHQHPEMADQFTYRNIGTHCTNMCVFKDICKTAIQGGNTDLVLKINYKTREVTK